MALNYFESYLASQGSWDAFQAFMRHDVRAVKVLVSVFAHSEYFSRKLIRSPAILDDLMDADRETGLGSRTHLERGLASAMDKAKHITDRLDALRRFKNREELRIGMADLMGALPLTTLFEQFHLDYDRDALQLGFRFEHYAASEDGTLGFSQFVQPYAAWRDGGLGIRVGNFHTLFGRGVVLRAFELPGVVRDEQFRQFGDSRDLDGAQVRYRRKGLDLEVISGKPRRVDEPPGTPRRGLVSGAQLSSGPWRGLRVGGEYVRLDAEDGSRTAEIPGGFAQWSGTPRQAPFRTTRRYSTLRPEKVPVPFSRAPSPIVFQTKSGMAPRDARTARRASPRGRRSVP